MVTLLWYLAPLSTLIEKLRQLTAGNVMSRLIRWRKIDLHRLDWSSVSALGRHYHICDDLSVSHAVRV
jgi:hypothetical protein